MYIIPICCMLSRVNPRQEVTPEGTVMAELSIGNVEAADSGSYFCQATNMYGRDQQLVQLTVQGKHILSKTDARMTNAGIIFSNTVCDMVNLKPHNLQSRLKNLRN